MERRWQVLILISVAGFLAFLDVTIVNIAFPDIRAEFPGSDLGTLSWVLNAYNVVFAALLVPAGRLADRIGRRRCFELGLAGFVVASLACAVAPSEAVLIAARIGQAVAAALLLPAAQGLLLPEFSPAERPKAVALFGAAAAAAAATGPTLGGAIVEGADWRWVFLVNIPIGLAALAWSRRLLVETPRESDARLPDPLGTLVLAAGIGLLALGITQGEYWGWDDPAVLASLAAAPVALLSFVLRTRRHAAPAVDLSLFGARAFSAANLSLLGFATAFYAMLFGNVLFLTSVWGYDVLTAGLAISPSPLMAMVSAPPAGRLVARFGARPVVAAGLLLYATGIVWFLSFATVAEPAYVTRWLPAAVLVGMGIGMTFSALSAAAVSTLPAARFAVGGAIANASRQLGAVLGVALIVAVIGTPGPAEALAAFQGGYVLMLGAAAFALAAALFIPSRRPEPAVRPDALLQPLDDGLRGA